MIRTETYYIDDREFTRTFSDAGRYVVRDGVEYEEACDPSEFHREYTEGGLMPSEGGSRSEAEEILDILIGGAS